MNSNLSQWIPSIIILLAAIGSALKDLLFNEQKNRRQKIFSVVLFGFLFLGALCSLWLTYSSDQQSKNIESLNRQIVGQNDDLKHQLSETKTDLSITREALYKRTDELVAKNGRIEELNNFILSSVTGGDSYCYLLPMLDEISGTERFILKHEGKYPVYDIQVRIIDQTMLAQLPFDKLYPKGSISKDEWEKITKKRDLWREFNILNSQAETLVDLATLTPGTTFFIEGPRIQESAQKQEYLIDIFARNGKISQVIKHMKVSGRWKTSMRVTLTGNEGKGARVVQEWLNPEVPL